MKWNKKQAGLIAGVVCVILLIILLLSMCRGGDGQSGPTQPVETSSNAVETTLEAEETVPVTESIPETTEETTEATEEATEPATGGSTRPGGTGGPGLGGGGSADDGDSTQPTTPKAGSEESPYMEVFAQFPDSVDTVAIPAEGTVHYSLSLEDESVDTYGESLLIIEAEDAYVLYNEVKYEAENGVISVPLTALYEEIEEEEEEGEAEEDAETEQIVERLPVALQICNVGAQAKSFLLRLDAPLGTVDNPQELQRDENGAFSLTAALEAGDKDGYYFDFHAERDGTFQLRLDSVPEDTPCDILVKAGDTSVSLPVDAQEPSVTLDFKKDDMVTVQVIAKSAEDGSYPAAEVKLSGSADYYGSKTNPIVVKENFTTEEMEPGLVLYYLVENQNGMALNVSEPAYVIYKDKTYQAPAVEETEPDDSGDSAVTEDEEAEPYVISVKIGNSDASALMAIGNGGEEMAVFEVTFGYPAGHAENKAPLIIKDEEAQIDGLNTAIVETGDTDVYWYRWTNDADTGVLTLKMPESGNWKYQIHHTSGTATTVYDVQYSDSVTVQRTVELLTKYEDVIDILVSTYDPANQTALPVGSVTFEASFLLHTLIAAEGDTLLSIDGNGMIYCKQGLKYADGAIMTVVAVEADEEGDVITDENGNVTVLTDRAYTIDYEGVVYTSENGKIVIEGIEMESADPDIFSFLNRSDEKTTYRISFSYPVGHQTNPKQIELGRHQIELYGDGGSGYYYSWTTTEPGTFVFEVEDSSYWSYNISMSSDTSVFSSTNNGSNTDFKTSVEITIGQSHINASKDGSVTILINLGNPSADETNKSLISFEIGTYKKKITTDDTVKVQAGQHYRLMQALETDSADGMIITGAESFTVVYDGVKHESENGIVAISNFRLPKAFFQIINNSSTEQTYAMKLTYPVGTPENPEVIQAGTWTVDLSTITEYYYIWKAPADGTFNFALPAAIDRYKPWAYDITHGEAVYSAKRGGKTTQAFAVAAGDEVSIKLGITQAVPNTVTVDLSVSFTETPAVSAIDSETTATVFEGSYVPSQFALMQNTDQMPVSIDLTQKYTLHLDKVSGYYYLSEGGPAVLVDFSSDTFVNLKKLLETEELYVQITVENGKVIKETYNTLLQKYLDNAAVITVSQEKTATLYPLTEDLMYILKNVGAQLGWYDSTNDAYLFKAVSGVQQDSLWMFPCCTIQTTAAAASDVAEEQPADPGKEIVTEDTATE